MPTLLSSILESAYEGLQGLQGLSNQGVQGRQGSQGLQGDQGLQGSPGNFQGTQGLQGLQGLSNQGVQGLQGTQGRQGLQGVQGLSNQGSQGLQGTQGLQGVQGLSNQGVQGLQGLQGSQGLQGVQGLSNQGVQGRQGLQGLQGLQGVQGAAAVSTIINATDDTSTATLYPVMVGATGVDQTAKARSTAQALAFNASTNTLSAANVYAGSATPTGTASQNLQVTGGAYVSGSVGIGTTRPTSTLQIEDGDTRLSGVIETVSAATTYMSGSAMVIEMDVRQATSYTYTMPTGANIGIVSFKNMPAQSNYPSGSTITLISTQNAAGTGNTTPTTGIGTNITVIGYENGAAVAGISTRGLVGSGTTVTLSTTGSDVDFVSFFINYTGGTNTVASSYRVYVTKNGGFRRGNVGV